MTEAFDPSGMVTFDLARGAVSVGGSEPSALVPVAALAAAAKALPEGAARELGLAIGRPIGERIAARLGGAAGVSGASIEVVTEQLAAELAVAGFGALALERWGQALVLVLRASENELFAPIAEGALGAATGKELATVTLDRAPGGTRVLVASRKTADATAERLRSGLGFRDALAKLSQTS